MCACDMGLAGRQEGDLILRLAVRYLHASARRAERGAHMGAIAMCVHLVGTMKGSNVHIHLAYSVQNRNKIHDLFISI